MSLETGKTNELLGNLRFLINKNAAHQTYIRPEQIFILARIDEHYITGKPQLIFSGETEPTIKTYPHLSEYTPQPNETVLISKVGNTFVILGNIQVRSVIA